MVPVSGAGTATESPQNLLPTEPGPSFVVQATFLCKVNDFLVCQVFYRKLDNYSLKNVSVADLGLMFSKVNRNLSPSSQDKKNREVKSLSKVTSKVHMVKVEEPRPASSSSCTLFPRIDSNISTKDSQQRRLLLAPLGFCMAKDQPPIQIHVLPGPNILL